MQARLKSHLVAGAMALLDLDDAVNARLAVHIGNQSADYGIAVSSLGGDADELFVAFHWNAHGLQLPHHPATMYVDGRLQRRWGNAGGYRLTPGVDRRPGDYYGGGGAVADLIAGAPGELAHRLHTHLPLAVKQVELLGDRMAVAQQQRRRI